MRRKSSIKLVVLVVFLPCAEPGLCQRPAATEASLCAVDANPEAFNGRMVKLRGSIARAEGLALYTDEKRCHTAMALRFADGHPKSRTQIQLVRDEAFRKFQFYVQALAKEQPKPLPGIVSLYAAPQYCEIRVTVVGEFQAVSREEALHGHGFGNAGASEFQLIVQSVLDPEAKECPSPPPAAKR